MKRFKFLILTGLVWAAPLSAGHLPSDTKQLFRSLDDDPQKLWEAAGQRLQKEPASGMEWALAVAALLENTGKSLEDRVSAETMQAATEWADREKHGGIKALLHPGKHAGTGTALQTAYEEALRLAQDDSEPWVRLRLMLAYAMSLNGQGRHELALQQIQYAQTLVSTFPLGDQAYARALVDSEMAVHLEAQNQADEALALYRRLESFCEQDLLREFCAKNAFNVGALYSNRQDISQWNLAVPYFEKAVRWAQEIGHDHRMGAGILGLAHVAVKQGEFKRAEHRIREAIAIFERAHDTLWLADSWVKLAHCLMELQQPEEALKALLHAEKLFPEDSYADFVEIQRLRAQVYKRMGQFQKALPAMEAYIDGYKRLQEDRLSQIYQKNLAQVAADGDAEKRRQLEKALAERGLDEAQLADLKMWLKLSVALSLSLLILVLVLWHRRTIQQRPPASALDLDVDSQDVADLLKSKASPDD